MADFLAGRDGTVTRVVDDGANLTVEPGPPSKHGIRDTYLPVADDWAERERRGRSTSADTPRCTARGCMVRWQSGPSRPCDEHAEPLAPVAAQYAGVYPRLERIVADVSARGGEWLSSAESCRVATPVPRTYPGSVRRGDAPADPDRLSTSTGDVSVHARLASATGQVRPVCIVRHPFTINASVVARTATGTGAVDSAVALSASPRRRTYSTPAGRAAQRAAALARWSDPQARARQSAVLSAITRGQPRPGQRHEDTRTAVKKLLLADPRLAVADVARQVGASEALVRPVRDELLSGRLIHRWSRKTRGAPFHDPSCWCRISDVEAAPTGDVSVTAGLAGAAGRSA